MTLNSNVKFFNGVKLQGSPLPLPSFTCTATCSRKEETLRLKILYRLYEKFQETSKISEGSDKKSSLHKILHFALSKLLWYELNTSCAVAKTYSF